MLDFIADIFEVLLLWILCPVIALFLLYLLWWHIARHMGLRCFFDKYIESVVEWIRDAFRD